MTEWYELNDLDFRSRQWHFVGILGSGMRSMATYALELGVRVTGSDLQSADGLSELAARGATVSLSQNGAAITEQTDLVVASQAIPRENRELRKARRLGIDVVRYPELLGVLMDYRKGVAVAGTHGKSTTSSIIAYVMARAGLDPSYLIGAEVPQLGGGAHCGEGEVLVAEACEYKRSFLCLAPHVAVITNIDGDHLDYFHNMQDIEDAFVDFARGTRQDGLVVANADDPKTRRVLDRVGVRTTTYGIEAKEADYRAERIWRAKVHSNFDLVYKGRKVDRFSSELYGTHNVQNTLAAIAACHELGMDFEQIQQGIRTFEGTARRLQLVGSPWDVQVLSDYAHHPREIEASLAAAHQRFPKQRVFVIFQPHQYSRTRRMLEEMAEAFQSSWVTYVCDIYAARDSQADRDAVSARDLVRQMNHIGLLAHYVPEFQDIEDIIVGDVISDDVVLVMGAGDVWKVAENIVPRIAEKGRRQIAA
ncbi:MAG: UDP-N-acetylmuramate--L-alanine ligase [Planctomycetota bacterium]